MKFFLCFLLLSERGLFHPSSAKMQQRRQRLKVMPACFWIRKVSFSWSLALLWHIIFTFLQPSSKNYFILLGGMVPFSKLMMLLLVHFNSVALVEFCCKTKEIKTKTTNSVAGTSMNCCQTQLLQPMCFTFVFFLKCQNYIRRLMKRYMGSFFALPTFFCQKLFV